MSQSFSSIHSKQNLSEIAYGQIRDALMQGRLEPGRRLVFRVIADEFGISPTPVRDAIQRLASEGALQLDDRGVACVPKINAASYIEIINLRIGLEGTAAAATATRSDCDVIANGLTKINDRMAKCKAEQKIDQALLENEQFHDYFVRAANMPVLHELVTSLWLRCGPSLRLLYTDRFEPLSVHPHLKLIEAIRVGNPEAARQSIQDDLRHAGIHILSKIDPKATSGWQICSSRVYF